MALKLVHNPILYKGKTTDFDADKVWDRNIMLFDTELKSLKIGDGESKYSALDVLNEKAVANNGTYVKTAELATKVAAADFVNESDFVDGEEPDLPDYVEDAIEAAGYINEDDFLDEATPVIPVYVENALQKERYAKFVYLDAEANAETVTPYPANTIIFAIAEGTLRIADGTTVFAELPVFEPASEG